MKNYNGIGLISNFVSLSKFSSPDRIFEDTDNELACAQLEKDPTIAVCMGTALWHNSAL